MEEISEKAWWILCRLYYSVFSRPNLWCAFEGLKLDTFKELVRNGISKRIQRHVLLFVSVDAYFKICYKVDKNEVEYNSEITQILYVVPPSPLRLMIHRVRARLIHTCFYNSNVSNTKFWKPKSCTTCWLRSKIAELGRQKNTTWNDKMKLVQVETQTWRTYCDKLRPFELINRTLANSARNWSCDLSRYDVLSRSVKKRMYIFDFWVHNLR